MLLIFSARTVHSLAAGLVAPVRDLDESLGGLGRFGSLLANDGYPALLIWNDTDSLKIPRQ